LKERRSIHAAFFLLFQEIHRMASRLTLNVIFTAIFAVLLLASPACSQKPPGSSSSPRQIEPGVSFYETTQPTAVRSQTTLWIYLPQNIKGKIPCVVIAPAGSPLIWGMKLGEGDRAEHLPYVRAGFAVVAYSIAGDVPEKPSDEQMISGIQAFRKANGGVSNTASAIDYALAHLPQVDPKRVYVAGHSSAGTLALLAAESDPRIRACVAYAPACDVLHRNTEFAQALLPIMPDSVRYFTQISPITYTAKLRCPLFLFHADDDSNVLKSDNVAFYQKLKTTNPQVTFSETGQGNHYDSMIQVGMPRAIAWLKRLKEVSP
jgi:dienelactone hydrolase